MLPKLEYCRPLPYKFSLQQNTVYDMDATMQLKHSLSQEVTVEDHGEALDLLQ